MLVMILKMSAMTALYVLLTLLLWRKVRNKKPGLWGHVGIGVIYGLCAVLSTHFGVDYGNMLVNVRDLAPLSAGLFFHPISGIVAGLIGGVERYIAGTWWNIGHYTRVSCAVSTCAAGFLSALLRGTLFKRRLSTPPYAFFIGALMEVFHMYGVFITHRNDISMAYYVVKNSSMPMILFTAIGMAASVIVIQISEGKWYNPFRRHSLAQTPIAGRFNRWLFLVALVIYGATFLLIYAVGTQRAIQSTTETLNDVAGDIKDTYEKVELSWQGISDYSRKVARSDAQVIARAISESEDPLDREVLEGLRSFFDLESLMIVTPEGVVLRSAGKAPAMTAMFSEVLNGNQTSQTARLSALRVAAAVACPLGMVQVTINPEGVAELMNLTGIDDTLSNFHVGRDGSFDIIEKSGLVYIGTHRNVVLSAKDFRAIKAYPREQTFTDTVFGKKSICRTDELFDGTILLTAIPVSEVYAERDSQAYEIALADILLFGVVFLLVSALVQQIVVNNLDLVNVSLAKITGGDLDEVVDVRKSSEFSSLSNDINQTVGVLKGYIDAAEKRIEQELLFAASIQDSALPRNFTFPRKDFELFAIMDPAKEVGGDFYDFFFVHGGRLALVIADVSGKGIPASLFMMRAMTAIRSLADSGNTPAEIFHKANNTLCDGNDAEMFVTAWIGIIDLDTGHMDCASAGHEYPVIMRAGDDYRLFKDKHGLPLAVMEGVPFTDYELQLNPGDRLFVYTDGVPEAINAYEEQYRCDRLVDRLNALKDAPMKDVLPAVREDISAFAGETEQFDDITMLGFAYFGSAADPQPAPQREEDSHEDIDAQGDH